MHISPPFQLTHKAVSCLETNRNQRGRALGIGLQCVSSSSSFLFILHQEFLVRLLNLVFPHGLADSRSSGAGSGVVVAGMD